MSTEPTERAQETSLFETDLTLFRTETGYPYSVLALRFVMAWVFLQAGLGKLAEGGWTTIGGFSAAGFLKQGIADANPLKPAFLVLADHTWLVDPLVMFGEIGIGLALLFGMLFRFGTMMGVVMMTLFWMAGLQGGLLAGLPVQNGYVIDSTLVYAVVLFGLGAWGAGRHVGIDRTLEQTDLVQEYPWLRMLLG